MNLLNKSEQRTIDFIEKLLDSEEWVTLKTIAQNLNCSQRILKDDINFINENFTDFQVLTSNKGVKIHFKRGNNLEILYQKILNNSRAYNLLETIFLNEGQSVSELANKFAVSVPTIYRLVDQINDPVNELHFTIETNPFHIVGDEKRIRYFFYQYFREKYTFINNGYSIVKNDEVLDNFLNFFIDFTQIPVDFAFYNIFKLVASVNLVRYMNNNYVDTGDIQINFDEIIPNLTVYNDVFKEFEETFNVEVTNDLINQMFTPYVQEGFSLSPHRLFMKAQENKALAETISLLDKILTDIAEQASIPLNNKERVIFSLMNAAHLEYQEPQAGHILYNQNQHFVDGIRNSFPTFCRLLYDGMKTYRESLDKPMTEEGINFFIYTAFTFWDDLVPNLRKKLAKIRVVVISDRHVPHAYMLSDFIKHEQSEQIEVEIYTHLNINREILESLDCDLIVTNFPTPILDTKPIVYIENVPTTSDLMKIQQAIRQIIIQRYGHFDEK